MRVWLIAGLVLAASLPQGPPGPPSAPGPRGQPPPAPARQTVPRVRSATGDALDRYVSGDYDGAIAALVYLGGFSTVDAEEWIAKGGAQQLARRRLTAASLALEVTAAKDAWPTTLVEWACESFRKAGPPSPDEALWMRASVALAEADGMWAILSDTAHLGHALARFPDDPHFRLAQAFVADAVASQPVVTIGRTVTDQTPVALDRLAARVPSAGAPATDRAALEHVAEMFRALAGDPVVGAEARLRLGDVLLRLGEIEAAVQAFRGADAAAEHDPFVSYLARLFLAWTDARAGRTDEAIRGYRSALERVPHARSASTLLSALLVTHGQVGEAEALTAGFLSAKPPAVDPWREYPRGDFRNYLALLDQLHEAIK